jgi:hypothetical protein
MSNSTVDRTTEEMDCCPPGGTKGGRGDVLFRLNAIHRDMHAGKDYGFEQSIWCDAVNEVSVLRQMLDTSHHPACKHRTRGIGAPGCICRTVRKS